MINFDEWDNYNNDIIYKFINAPYKLRIGEIRLIINKNTWNDIYLILKEEGFKWSNGKEIVKNNFNNLTKIYGIKNKIFIYKMFFKNSDRLFFISTNEKDDYSYLETYEL